MLKNKYFFRNKSLIVFFSVLDFIGQKIINHKEIPSDFKPEKILISNIGHLGDVFLSIKVLEEIKERFPDSKIYFLCSSWSLKLIEKNPIINEIIIYDSFFLSSEKNFVIRIYKTLKSFLNAFFSIKKIKPDIAFDLRASFPNTLLLLGLSGVKHICGYQTAGFGFFCDKKVVWRDGAHETEHFFNVIRPVWDVASYESFKPINLDYLISDLKDVDLLNKYGINKEKYLVFHVVSRDKRKMIDINKWIDLFNYFSSKYQILFTGSEEESEYINKYFKDFNNTINLAGKLSIGELVLILKNSFLTVTLDSFVGQICSVLNLNSIIIFSGGVDIKRFGPLGDRCRVIKKDIFCSPCSWYIRSDCKYECMDIDVLSEFKKFEKEIE
ncbi:MAG TPA: glycosyltransferase family 9 protein [Elusimicrobiales bacterium]|nr:glycosyltransferase family 9 protein [Elusimicrobiales bacterium]HOL63223.1 glycosyltransferase family 9 protein [Elusimicrobiales bacterium]HPO94889.1 glycosyltransferase family 9 protein [Elusimicrobiales bacterium]